MTLFQCVILSDQPQFFYAKTLAEIYDRYIKAYPDLIDFKHFCLWYDGKSNFTSYLGSPPQPYLVVKRVGSTVLDALESALEILKDMDFPEGPVESAIEDLKAAIKEII